MYFLIILIIVAVVFCISRQRQKKENIIESRECQSSMIEKKEVADLRSRLLLRQEKSSPLTISLPKHLFSVDSAVVLQSTVIALQDVADVYLIVSCSDVAESESVLEKCSEILPHFCKHRILMHTSSSGKVAMVRQLKSHIHIEFDDDIRKKLKPHVNCVLGLCLDNAPPAEKQGASRVISGLEELLNIDLRLS